MFQILERKNHALLAGAFVVLFIVISALMILFHRPQNTYSHEFEQYLESAAERKSMSANFSSITIYTVNNVSYVNEQNGTIASSGTKKRIDTTVKTQDGVIVPVVTLTDGKLTHGCFFFNESWYCSFANALIPVDSKSTLATLKKLYDKGAIIFADEKKQREIDGKTCTEINAEMIVEKLEQEEKYHALYSSGAGNMKDFEQRAGGLVYANFSLCFADGISLHTTALAYVEKPDKAIHSQESTLGSLRIGGALDPALFMLPENFTRIENE